MIKNNCKALVAFLLALMAFVGVKAQNGANSPMTRYGFGQLADQNSGLNRAMGGIGIGLRDNTQINLHNPASYAAVDSLTCLFEVGFSMQNTNFSDGTTSLNAKNSSFDYLAMQFRLFKGMGMTLGFLPYSNIGYNFSSTESLPAGSMWDDPVTVTRSNVGDGGLHQAFIGVGYDVLKNLSVGLNVSYMFGEISHKASATFSDANIYPLVRNYFGDISDVKLDFGAQYVQNIGKKDYLTLGVTYSLGKNLNATEAYISEQKLNGSTVLTETVKHISKPFQLPHAVGIGATYVHDDRLTVGADFLWQKFGSIRFFGEEGTLADRLKASVGAQFHPDPVGQGGFFKRMKYRVGAYYSKPYIKVNGLDAAHEYGVGGGIAFPVSTWGWLTQRSIINISGEWVRVEPKIKGVLTENYLRLSIGLTFNERWFMKQKVR